MNAPIKLAGVVVLRLAMVSTLLTLEGPAPLPMSDPILEIHDALRFCTLTPLSLAPLFHPLQGPSPYRRIPSHRTDVTITDWLWLEREAPPIVVWQTHLVNSTPPSMRKKNGVSSPVWKAVAPKATASWAYTSLDAESAGIFMAQLTAAEILFVNGEGFWGDPRSYGFEGVPVALRRGRNDIFVTGIDGPFALRLWRPDTRCVIGTWDVRWPFVGEPLVAPQYVEDTVEFPVFNASLRAIPVLHIDYAHVVPEDERFTAEVREWADFGFVAPLAMTWVQTYFWDLSPRDDVQVPTAVIPICAYSHHVTENDVEEPGEGETADCEHLRGPFRTASGALQSPHSERSAAALEGSLLSHYTTESRCFVYATGGTEDENLRSLARARFDQQLVTYFSGRAPILVSDREFLRSNGAFSDYALIVYGNEDTNLAWSEALPERLAIRVHRGRVNVAGEEFRVDAGGWIALGRVAVIFDTGPLGATMGYFSRWISAPLHNGDNGNDYAVYVCHEVSGYPVPLRTGRLLDEESPR